MLPCNSKTIMGCVMKISITVQIEAPEGATHYFGDILDEPTFVKCSQIGVVGDHWFAYDKEIGWHLLSHEMPHWIKQIPEQNKIN